MNFDNQQDVLIRASILGLEDPSRRLYRAVIKGTDGKCCHEVPAEQILPDYAVPTLPPGLGLPWQARDIVRDAKGNPVKSPDQVRYGVAAANSYATLEQRLAIVERAYVETLQQGGGAAADVSATVLLGELYDAHTLVAGTAPAPMLQATFDETMPTPQVMLSSEEADARQAAYDQLRQPDPPQVQP